MLLNRRRWEIACQNNRMTTNDPAFQKFTIEIFAEMTLLGAPLLGPSSR